jgi:Flp pilus assembly pilin Flp
MKDYLLKAYCALQTDRRGVTALEYAVVAGLVVTAVAGLFATLFTDVGTALTDVGNKVIALAPAG